uniref:Uncharacterized protein n=1 Tax=Knipowitschia caucasica TaxID=637954 RepID=A0AAV2LSK2_KNICA
MTSHFWGGVVLLFPPPSMKACSGCHRVRLLAPIGTNPGKVRYGGKEPHTSGWFHEDRAASCSEQFSEEKQFCLNLLRYGLSGGLAVFAAVVHLGPPVFNLNRFSGGVPSPPLGPSQWHLVRGGAARGGFVYGSTRASPSLRGCCPSHPLTSTSLGTVLWFLHPTGVDS